MYFNYDYVLTNHNDRNFGGKRSSTKYIIIHYTGNVKDTAENNAKYFFNGDRRAGANFFVDGKGVWASTPEAYTAYGAGVLHNRKYAKLWGICTNHNAINIEIACDAGNSLPTAEAVTNAVELTKSLMAKYGIPASNVVRHKDVCGKNCLPIDTTELLTPNGWVNLGKLSVGDEIYQYNKEKDILELTNIKDVVEPYNATVLKNRSLEATENHRMLLKYSSKNTINYSVKYWGDIVHKTGRYLIKTSGHKNNIGLPLTDDELRLLVWIQADGHYMKKKHNDDIYGIEFHFSKERKIECVSQLLERLGLEYKRTNQTNGTVKLRIYDVDVYHFAEKYLSNKNFTYKFVDMTDKQFDVFWNELLLADGCVAANSYCSRKEINLDVVQAICVTHGVRTNICQTGISRSIIRTNTNYGVGINVHVPREKQITERETLVSCVTVDSGFILIRQNGKTFIVGNCPAYWWDDAKWQNEFKSRLSGGAVQNVSPAPIPKPNVQPRPQPKHVNHCDGVWGEATTRALQKYLGTVEDGIISHQLVSSEELLISRFGHTFRFDNTRKGSLCIRALQKKLGVTVDGLIGKNTIKALQRWLDVTADGVCGKNTTLALQKFLDSKGMF